MKRIALAALALLLIVGAAYAGPELSFDHDAIENSSARDFGATYDDWACQVNTRTGVGNIVLELQGRIETDVSITNDLSWVAMTNSMVVNATSAITNNTSWHFQKQDWYARQVRMHVTSGAGAANTVSGTCTAGGR